MGKLAPEDKAIEMFLKFVKYCDRKQISYEYMVRLALREHFINRKI